MANEASAFKAGDLVQLKSGGPKMTVTAVNVSYIGEPSSDVACKWFFKNELKESRFNPDTLRHVGGDVGGGIELG